MPIGPWIDARQWSSSESDWRPQGPGRPAVNRLAAPCSSPFPRLNTRVNGAKREDAPLIAAQQSMLRVAVLCTVLCGSLAAVPARAQLGSIFGDSPPRPPAGIPNGSLPPQPPPVQFPGQAPPAAPPQQYPAQSAAAPAAPASSPSGIQSQPLPPPPGAVMAPAATNRMIIPPPGAPGSPDQAPQRAGLPPSIGNQPQQPADATAPTDDTVVIETPTQKIENSRAVFAGLDKITGRIISFDAAIGETVQFGALRVVARACYTRPPTEATNTDAFVQVDEVTLQGEVKRIFSGWMFAASPGLHAVEHPIYDVWLTDCASPIKVAEPPATPAPARAPASSRTRQAAQPRQQPATQPPSPIQVQPQ